LADTVNVHAIRFRLVMSPNHPKLP